ncbi:MAG: dihydroorotate dehydrogenase [Fimbriimonadales bacterium]
MTRPDLRVTLGRLNLSNPIMVASGTFGYGLEYESLVDLNQLGALVVKSLTLHPRLGNPPPRVAETPAGMLNTIGLQNEGVEAFLLETLPRLRDYTMPLIVSVAGETPDDYAEVARRLQRTAGIAALELNLSCPNQARGGMEFGIDSQLTAEVVRAVRQVSDLPLFAKLTPNVTDIVPIAEAAVSAGAEGLTLINSVVGLAVNPQTRRFRLATRTGGLTGPAIKPIALHAVWRVHQALPEVPLMGVGGITSVEDVLEFLLVGATAVQVGTGNYLQSSLSIDLIADLSDYLRQHEIPTVRELIGAVQDAL